MAEVGQVPWEVAFYFDSLPRELEHQTTSLREKLILAKNQLHGSGNGIHYPGARE